jgi:hypothetical protein
VLRVGGAEVAIVAANAALDSSSVGVPGPSSTIEDDDKGAVRSVEDDDDGSVSGARPEVDEVDSCFLLLL